MDVKKLEQEAASALEQAGSLEQLEELRVRFLGRSSELKLALREVRDRESGMSLNALRQSLETAFEERRSALEQIELQHKLMTDSVDVTLPGERLDEGHLHLITQIRREVEDVFLGLGYTIVDGREV